MRDSSPGKTGHRRDTHGHESEKGNGGTRIQSKQMDAKNLIETLRARGLNFEVEGDDIKVEASREPDLETKGLLGAPA